MIFVSSRDVKANPAVLWKNDEVVVTVNGKPKAIVIKIDGDPKEIFDAVDSVRAQIALEKLRLYSIEKGLDKLTDEEIEKIIREVRSHK